MAQISILGCGWLGLPLAESLIKNGFTVKGSTTSANKTGLLQNSGINPFQITVSENGIEGDINAFLKNSEILIIDIPPKLRGSEKENFVLKIKTVASFIEKSEVKKVLFISSTSVYADDNSTVTEATVPLPQTESGIQLLESENLLKSNPQFETTVLRFGGLIGNNRQPVIHLAGRQNLENPEGPINLIHLRDCIGIILKIIQKEKWDETFNAVAPFHPTRKDYYTRKATELSLPVPQFSNEPSFGKTVDSAKLINLLDYQFTGDY